jgi:hypothetical protein
MTTIGLAKCNKSSIFPISFRGTALGIYSDFQTSVLRGEGLNKFMDSTSYFYPRHGFDVAMEGTK